MEPQYPTPLNTQSKYDLAFIAAHHAVRIGEDLEEDDTRVATFRRVIADTLAELATRGDPELLAWARRVVDEQLA